ncbi:guanine nucleotide binding protein, alpha subunit [Mycena epipterygia]|nr:guanine nucleotide binding protein, alpha subunit [Mycena epipterygia]
MNYGTADSSAKIDELLQKERKLARSTVKVFVLGIQGSGKATFMRQFKSIHEPYSDDERCKFKTLIHASVVRAARQFLSQVPDELCATTHVLECRKLLSSNGALTEELARTLHTLWLDDELRAASKLDKSAIYFLDSLNRISSPDYTPTDSDILRCQMLPHPPIDEFSVTIGNWTYSLVCARQSFATKHKWLPCFDTLPSVIFVLNLDDYDRPECMREAIDLFTYVYDNFHGIHLLLNKPASFHTKLVTSPLDAIYPDYDGGNDEIAAVQHISRPFRIVTRNARYRSYIYIVDLASADGSRAVMSAIIDSHYPRLGCVMI